jgi:hypothetical protein
MNLPDNHQCRQCLEKIEAILSMQWEQSKTLSALFDRIEREGDRLQELFQAAEREREQMRIAVIEQYLIKRLNNIVPEIKKGAKRECLITFSKTESSV